MRRSLTLSTLLILSGVLTGCGGSTPNQSSISSPAPTTATLSPTALAFNNVTVGSTGAVLSTTLTNTGTTGLIISSGPAVTGTGFSLSSTTCGASLNAGAACVISVSFVPTAVQSYSGTLSITDNASSSPQTATLSGAGITLPSPNSCGTPQTTSPTLPAPTANYAGVAFTGSVKAGTVGVIGASVQLYAAGTTGNGSTPTALLSAPLTTDSNGNFSVPATFTCPYSNSVVYAVATGGKAGASGPTNAGIVLMSVLGVCNNLTRNGSYTINEATTVAGAYAMAQFLKPGGVMGASSTNSTGIGLAAATAANLVNTTTGVFPGTYFPATGTAPAARMGSLANLLDACIVSSGAGSSVCTQLYADTTVSGTAPANTLDAALSIAKNPGNNVAALYTLSQAASAFSPSLAAQPSDWTMYATYSGGGMNDPSAIGIDSLGNVWVANYFDIVSYFTNAGSPIFSSGLPGNQLNESYGGAVDYTNTFWPTSEQSEGGFNGDDGAVPIFNTSGSQLGILGIGGLNFPLANAFDTSANMWVVDYGDSSVSVYATGENPLAANPLTNSPYTSGQLIFPVAVAIDSQCNAWVANQAASTITKISGNGSSFASFTVGSGPSGVAVDASNNVWSANYYGNSIGLVSAAGSVLSGSGYTGGGIDHPQGIAIDGAGTVWVANYRGPSLSELAGATATKPGALLSPSAGWGPDAQLLEAFALAIDASGNLWVSNFGSNTLTEFIGMAVPVKTPLLGPVRVP
jgi:hypothetical protein